MKKVLSVVLAAATVLSLGASAFAATSIGDVPVYYDDNKAVAGANNNDTVTPDQKVYVKLSDVAEDIIVSEFGNQNTVAADELAELLDDTDWFKFSYKKGSDNSKMITGISLVEKKLGGNARDKYIEIKLADTYSDDEFKISPTFTFTVKEDMSWDNENGHKYWVYDEDKVAGGQYRFPLADGDKFEGEFTLWISNELDNADKDYEAGTGGVVIKPTENDDNEIVWYDENQDIAKLTFEGDSDTNKFFPKLSTKWDNSTYAEYFADQDAFIFDFVSNPEISSTSRPVLTIYDPYYDWEEDETTVDAENVVVYKVVDGELVDDTANWNYGETEDGEMAYTCKTRQLGTYIFCEVAVAGAEEVVDPDGGKDIPNTGR